MWLKFNHNDNITTFSTFVMNVGQQHNLSTRTSLVTLNMNLVHKKMGAIVHKCEKTQMRPAICPRTLSFCLSLLPTTTQAGWAQPQRGHRVFVWRSDVALKRQSEASGALTHQYCPGIKAPQACGEVREMPRPTAPEAGYEACGDAVMFGHYWQNSTCHTYMAREQTDHLWS